MRLTAILIVFLGSTAAMADEALMRVCNGNTLTATSYQVCLDSGVTSEQAQACAYQTVTMGTFKGCLDIAKEKNVSASSIIVCGQNTLTQRSFFLCLKRSGVN